MYLSKEVSKSDKEHLSSNDSDRANDEKTSSMSEQERTHNNNDISLSSTTSSTCETSNKSSEESSDIKATSLGRSRNNLTISPTIHPPVFLSNLLPIASCRGGSIVQHLSSPLLTHLDPHNTGFLHPHTLLHYWSSLGVTDGSQVLEDLGLSVDEELLDLRIVSKRLNEEIGQALEILRYPLLQAAITTLLEEVMIVKNTLDNVTKERNKYRSDIQEAQRNAKVLAMEIDEQFQALGQKLEEEIKSIDRKTNRVCEAKEKEIKETKRMLEFEKRNIEEIEVKMKKEIKLLSQSNKQLEDEINNTNSKLRESMELNSCLKLKVDNAKILTGRLLAIESYPEVPATDASLELIKNIEDLVRVNKDLKDRNDELELNMLSITFEDCSASSLRKKKGVHLQESSSPSFRSKMNEKNPPISLETPSPDLKYHDDDYESYNDEDNILSFSDILCNFDEHDEDTTHNLPHHCQTLEDELDHVKFEIVKMMSVKDASSKESQTLQNYEVKISELEEENKNLKQAAKHLELSPKTDPRDQQQPDETLSIPDILVATSSFVDLITNTDRTSPDGQEIDDECLVQPCQPVGGNSHQLNELEETFNKLRESKFLMESEKLKLHENNEHLEESLGLMQTEFESMEDYWQKTIDEERVFYEEQLKVSESQFQELELRMKKYEEILNSFQSTNDKDRLTLHAIDEQRSLEEEVNEWEEEISQLKLQIEEMQAIHKKEILIMKKEMEKERLSIQHKNIGGLELFSQKNDFNFKKCGYYATLSKKRKNLESSWQRVVESDMNLRTSSAIEKDNLKSSALGPSSLPPDSVLNDKIEVKRLEELRQHMQEDCDQLLLKKERLKNEIARLTLKMNDNCMTCLPFSDGKVGHGQCDKEGSKDESYDVGTQVPPGVAGVRISGRSFSSPFQCILFDISTQKRLLDCEMSTASSHHDKLLLSSLQSRLSAQATRCQHLHSSLALQRERCTKGVAEARDHHMAEISQLQYLVSSSQELLRKQVMRFMDQVEELEMSDRVIEKLIEENQNLVEAIQEIKERWPIK